MAGETARRERGNLRLLYRLEASLEAPMFLLAVVWLWLFAVELFSGLTPFQQRMGTAIWIAFISEYLLKLAAAPRRLSYIRRNWLTLVALAIPAFRAFRLLRAVRLMRSARVVTTTRFVRALTSTRRFTRSLEEVQGARPAREVSVGILLYLTTEHKRSQAERFADQLCSDVREELQRASGISWQFQAPKITALATDAPRRPSSYIEDASRLMADGPFDMVAVLTDAVLISRRQLVQPGLASPTSRILCLSLHALTRTSRGQAPRSLDAPLVRWTAANLLLHLIGHLSGLAHTPKGESKVMAPVSLRNQRSGLSRFTTREERKLQSRSRQLPERELQGSGPLASLLFHLLMVFRHPRDVVVPLLKSRALLLPFSLPRIATAAVAPTLILVFSAETWDVGLNLDSGTLSFFAGLVVLLASFYLVTIQSLFFPRKEKDTVTEHLAVANAVIFLSILLACLGLFVMVVLLMLAIQIYVFPEDLIRTWPTLRDPTINLFDQLRLAAFISTIGVATGALAGGFESRSVIQHLALFNDEP